MDEASEEDELTAPKAAERAGVTRGAINAAIRAGVLAARRIETPRGPLWLVKAADVDAWRAAGESGPRRGRPRKGAPHGA